MSALALDVIRLASPMKVQAGHTLLLTETGYHHLDNLRSSGWMPIDAGWEIHLVTDKVTGDTIVGPLVDRRPCADCGLFMGMVRQDHRPAAAYCPPCAIVRLEAGGHG